MHLPACTVYDTLGNVRGLIASGSIGVLQAAENNAGYIRRNLCRIYVMSVKSSNLFNCNTGEICVRSFAYPIVAINFSPKPVVLEINCNLGNLGSFGIGRILGIGRIFGIYIHEMTSYSSGNAILKGNNNAHSGFLNLNVAVTLTALIAVGKVPRLVNSNLEVVLTCCNIIISLYKMACFGVILKLVSLIRNVPAFAEESGVIACCVTFILILHYIACDDISCNSLASGTLAVVTIRVTLSKLYNRIGFTTLRAGVRSFAFFGTGSLGNYSALACGSVSALACFNFRPGSAALIPGAFLNSIMVVTIILKVCGLIPFIIPIISCGARVHSTEDNVSNSGGNYTLICTVTVGIGHIEPLITTIPCVNCKTSIALLPVRVGSKENCRFLCCCSTCNNSSHANKKCKSNKKRK